jgi:hypothetical protein
MYMPVAELTCGGTPILKSSGLNMLPPPIPSAPDTQPPISEKTINLIIFGFVSSISLLLRVPYSFLSSYSLFCDLTEYNVNKKHILTNTNIPNQSSPEHILMPKTLGFTFEPL